MANNEETQNTNIIFRGTDGNECEAFVVAIRDLAFAKGKEEDHHWMLHYATTRLRGRALRWHAKLDLSTQKDWYLFVQALFEEYPFVEATDEVRITTPVWTSTTLSPTPSTATLPSNDRQLIPPFISPPTDPERVSARRSQPKDPIPLEAEHVAPPRPYDPSLPGVHTGRLLVIYEEGRQGYHYISASSKRTTSNIHEALIVTLIPSPEPHAIGCINSVEPKLAVRLSRPDSSKPRFYPVAGSHYADRQVDIYRTGTQDISSIWNVSTDGRLSAKLPHLVPKPDDNRCCIPSEYFTTTVAYVDISGATISFVKDDGTSPAENPNSGLPSLRAHIVFEPI